MWAPSHSLAAMIKIRSKLKETCSLAAFNGLLYQGVLTKVLLWGVQELVRAVPQGESCLSDSMSRAPTNQALFANHNPCG